MKTTEIKKFNKFKVLDVRRILLVSKGKAFSLKWIIWSISFTLTLLMIVVIVPDGARKIISVSDNSDHVKLLDAEFFGFSKNAAFETLQNLGEGGREAYVSFHKNEDLIFPVFYGIFLAFTLNIVTTKLFPDHRKLIIIITLIPLAGMVMDFIENYHILKLIKQFPDLQSSTVFIAAAANSLKWGAAFISIGLILMFGVLVVRAKIAGKKTQIHA